MADWTKEEDDLLTRLYDIHPPLSMSQIAAKFKDRSRNSILGRAHRLGLAGTPQQGDARKLARAFPKATIFELAEALAADPDEVRTALNIFKLERIEGSEKSYRTDIVAAMRATLMDGEAA